LFDRKLEGKPRRIYEAAKRVVVHDGSVAGRKNSTVFMLRHRRAYNHRVADKIEDYNGEITEVLRQP
jgi:hypothetical protein